MVKRREKKILEKEKKKNKQFNEINEIKDVDLFEQNLFKGKEIKSSY